MNSRQPRRIMAGAGLTLAATLGLPASAHALNLEVDTTIDQAPDDDCGAIDECTLRDAIDRINDVGDPSNLITFQAGLSGTIALTQGQIEIMDPVTIQGPGADVLTVSGGDSSRIFYMQTPPAAFDVTIAGLTLADGKTAGKGGAIYDELHRLTIRDSVLSGNSAGSGGAVYTTIGELSLIRTTVQGNDATSDGGGVMVEDTDLTVLRSTFSGNTAGIGGGGIKGLASRVDVEGSTISGNQAPNTITGTGGGINVQLNFPDDVVTIGDSTIANNTAGSSGGGISASDGGMPPPDPTLTNTIVANNTADFPGVDLSGDFDAAFSLVEVGSVDTTVPGSNILGRDPQLGLLVNNGGPTLTRKPRAGSPAIDKGSTTASTDQRGRARPFDVPHIGNSSAAGADGADIGSVELTGPEAGARKCGGKGATIVGKRRRVTGTNKADVIVGTKGANLIRGRGGRDVICGLGGPDILIGGGGPDTLIGGPGADTLRGGPGRDKLKGGPGSDVQRQ